jgi:hypothetical protein
MNLNQIRAFSAQTIAAAHDAGWHREAFRLGDKLYDIGYQPTPEAAARVLDYAQWLAACLAC